MKVHEENLVSFQANERYNKLVMGPEESFSQFFFEVKTDNFTPVPKRRVS